MVDAMINCIEAYPACKLNNAFIPLFNNYNSILEEEGDNHFKIKHMSKAKLIQTGQLPTYITVTNKEINPDLYFSNQLEQVIDNDFTLDIDESDSDSSCNSIDLTGDE